MQERGTRAQRETPFWAFLVVAAVIHGSVTLVGWSRERALPRQADAAPERIIELSVIDLPPDGTSVQDPAAAPAPGGGEPEAVAALRGSTPRPAVLTGAEPAEPEPEPSDVGEEARADSAEQAGPGATGGDSPSVGRLTLEQLGLGAANPFIDRKDAPSRAGAQQHRAEQSLRRGMLERDAAVGMARGGVVVAALEEATRVVASPLNGQATFLATTDAAGNVVSVEATSASSRLGDFQKAAARALRALAGKKVRVPAGAKGLAIQLTVTARNQLPSGRDPGLSASILGIPLKKGDGERSTSIDLLKPSVSIETEQVQDPAGGSAPFEIPVLKVGLKILGLSGDPVDIGAVARRVVHARITSEEPL